MRAGWLLALSLVLYAPSLRGAVGDCLEMDDATLSRALRVAARYLHADKEPALDKSVFVQGTCYRQLFLFVPGTGRRTLLYLSPDQQFLLPALWDISVDPEVQDRQLAARLREDAKQIQVPSRGPDVAPVEVTVFSDFQCPYCAMFNGIIERYRQEHPNTIRVLFRNFPLPMHNWAVAAARAGICLFQQSPGAFWEIHDMFFAQQKTLSQENLESLVEQFVAGHSELNRELYATCETSAATGNRLELDLSRAREYDIQNTPTVIVNGRRYLGFRDDAAFASAIDEAIRSKSFNDFDKVKEEQGR